MSQGIFSIKPSVSLLALVLSTQLVFVASAAVSPSDSDGASNQHVEVIQNDDASIVITATTAPGQFSYEKKGSELVNIRAEAGSVILNSQDENFNNAVPDSDVKAQVEIASNKNTSAIKVGKVSQSKGTTVTIGKPDDQTVEIKSVMLGNSKEAKKDTLIVKGKNINFYGPNEVTQTVVGAYRGSNVEISGTTVRTGRISADQNEKASLTASDQLATGYVFANNSANIVLSGQNKVTTGILFISNSKIKVNADSEPGTVEVGNLQARRGSQIVLGNSKTALLNASEINAEDEGTTVSVNAKKITTGAVNATNKAQVIITGETGTFKSITQNGGTVTVNLEHAKIDQLDLGSGSQMTLKKLDPDSKIALYLDEEPALSSFLTLEEAPDAPLEVEWLSSELLKKLPEKKANKSLVQVPFALVKNPQQKNAFKVGDRPFVRGFERGDLVIGKGQVGNAPKGDKAFLNGASEGDYYYAALAQIALNDLAQDRLNAALGLGHSMATDLIDSVRGRVLSNRYDLPQKDVWATFEHNHLKSQGAHANTDRLEAGFTVPVLASYGTHNVGLSMMAYRGKGELDSESSRLKSDVMSLGLVDTLYRDNGQYVNLVARLGRLKNTFNYDNDGDALNASYITPFAMLSAEVGQRFDLDGLYAIPQVQFQYTYTKGKTTSLGEGVLMTLDSNQALVGRLGVLVGKKFSFKGVGFDTYATADLIQSFIDKQSVHIAGEGNFDWQIKDKSTTPRIGVGVNVIFPNNVRGYAQVNTRFGVDKSRNNEVKAGVNYRF